MFEFANKSKPRTSRRRRTPIGCDILENRITLNAGWGVPSIVAVNPQPLPPSGTVVVYHPPNPCVTAS